MHTPFSESGEERRKYPRRGILAHIAIVHKDGLRSYEGKALDISEGGIGFATDVPLNIMAPIRVQVHQSRDLPSNKRYSGTVVWRAKTNDLDTGIYRYGIRFHYPE